MNTKIAILVRKVLWILIALSYLLFFANWDKTLLVCVSLLYFVLSIEAWVFVRQPEPKWWHIYKEGLPFVCALAFIPLYDDIAMFVPGANEDMVARVFLMLAIFNLLAKLGYHICGFLWKPYMSGLLAIIVLFLEM